MITVRTGQTGSGLCTVNVKHAAATLNIFISQYLHAPWNWVKHVRLKHKKIKIITNMWRYKQFEVEVKEVNVKEVYLYVYLNLTR